MLKRMLPFLLGTLSACYTGTAGANDSSSPDNDSWLVYDRASPDNSPLVVIARNGNAEANALIENGKVTVISCRPKQAISNENDMPQFTDSLYALEDKLDREPLLVAAHAIHVASVTGLGQRRIFVAHRDPVDFAPILQASSVPEFSCVAAELIDRKELISLVTPTLLEIQLNGDQSVIANLQEHGDDGHVARKTDFWFYGEKRALSAVAAKLKSHGFAIDHWISEPTGIVLSREMPVDMETFSAMTPIILEAAGGSGIKYDGWETFFVSKNAMQSEKGPN